MSKRSRRRSALADEGAVRGAPAGEARRAPGTDQRRARRPSQPPRRRRIALRWLIVAGAAAVVAIVAAVALLGPNRSLPGLQSGAAPWPPEVAHLRSRLDAIGLQVLTAEGEAQHTHEHLDLFVDGQPIAVPPDIGIDRAAGFLAPIHTHDATGIIHVESPLVRDFTLGEFFDVWGVRFDRHCVGGSCDGNGRSLSVYVNGQLYPGDPRALVLAEHQEIVVAIGTPAQLPNPIPPVYAFPAGL